MALSIQAGHRLRPHSVALQGNKRTAYGAYLLVVAGLGGLLYGIDVGIISAALLYLGKTVDLTELQTSVIVAAVLGGSMISSLVAGLFADWLGRKTMMIVSGLLFVLSVALIVASHGFVPLFLGRLLQGLSGGVIAVVVPLYLAECLSPATRGRGLVIFQFMLTFGIVCAVLVGFEYVHGADAAIAAAHGNAVLIHAAEDHAWRGMFLAVIYPGVLFFAGTFFLSETPRWLFRRGRVEAAYAVLLRSSSVAEADRELHEMQDLAAAKTQSAHTKTSLLQRRYVVPFVLACVVLGCNQATGINSILAYLSLILRQAGMSAGHAARGNLLVTVLNCVMTLVAIPLVDRRGRKLLLSVGTGGIIIALIFTGFVFRGIESNRTDVQPQLQAMVNAGHSVLSSTDARSLSSGGSTPVALRVSYSRGGSSRGGSSRGGGERIATVFSNGADSVDLGGGREAGQNPVHIDRAFLTPLPSPKSGWLVTLGLALFIAFYAAGPGVVVWLALSELMPTRIRSAGMGIALLLNQGISTLIAGVFLPVVSKYGYYAMFFFWAGCTVIYFLTAVFFLPETKGKSLEEIESSFAGASAPS